MAGMEIIVRPAVMPNIRPAPAPAVAPQDTPDKGIATLGGSGSKTVDISHHVSISSSNTRSHQQEQERTVDEVRVYQKEDDGTINKTNFVDTKVTKKLRTVDPAGVKTSTKFAPTKPTPDNVEVLQEDVKVNNPDYQGPTEPVDSRVPTGPSGGSFIFRGRRR
jgi:hypothetical protein